MFLIQAGLWDLWGGSQIWRDMSYFTMSLRRILLQRKVRMVRARDQVPGREDKRQIWRQILVAKWHVPLLHLGTIPIATYLPWWIT